jgi:hypothetical protein
MRKALLLIASTDSIYVDHAGHMTPAGSGRVGERIGERIAARLVSASAAAKRD